MKSILSLSFLIILLLSMTVSKTNPLENPLNSDLYGQWIIKNQKDAGFIASRGEQMLADTISFHKDGKYSSALLTHDKFTWSADADSIITIWDNVNMEAIEYKYYIRSNELNIVWGNSELLLNYRR